MSFHTLGLKTELLRAVEEQGYSTPTPIQKESIPVILEGRDIMARAQTGTGKTAGFALPLLQRLTIDAKPSKQRIIRALILTPTRELAAQVAESMRVYGKYLPFKATAVFGGVNIQPQFRKLRGGVDILVATPGRLLDHVRQRTVDLSKVEILVLDEADQMLDMGFIDDVKKITQLLPKRRQNLLFSATFSDAIKQLASKLLQSPVLIEVAKQNEPAALVSHIVYFVEHKRKRELLSFLIGSKRWTRVLVFCRTKRGVNRLVDQLIEDGIEATGIHGNKSQGARTKALADFKKGVFQVLVATDVAARGLNIEQLPHVINFEMPQTPKDYIHRIGRTGRAGKTGEAISLVDGNERRMLKDIERLLKCKVEKIIVPGYEPNSPVKAVTNHDKHHDKHMEEPQPAPHRRSSHDVDHDARHGNKGGHKNGNKGGHKSDHKGAGKRSASKAGKRSFGKPHQKSASGKKKPSRRYARSGR